MERNRKQQNYSLIKKILFVSKKFLRKFSVHCCQCLPAIYFEAPAIYNCLTKLWKSTKQGKAKLFPKLKIQDLLPKMVEYKRLKKVLIGGDGADQFKGSA